MKKTLIVLLTCLMSFTLVNLNTFKTSAKSEINSSVTIKRDSSGCFSLFDSKDEIVVKGDSTDSITLEDLTINSTGKYALTIGNDADDDGQLTIYIKGNVTINSNPITSVSDNDAIHLNSDNLNINNVKLKKLVITGEDRSDYLVINANTPTDITLKKYNVTGINMGRSNLEIDNISVQINTGDATHLSNGIETHQSSILIKDALVEINAGVTETTKYKGCGISMVPLGSNGKTTGKLEIEGNGIVESKGTHAGVMFFTSMSTSLSCEGFKEINDIISCDYKVGTRKKEGTSFYYYTYLYDVTNKIPCKKVVLTAPKIVEEVKETVEEKVDNNTKQEETKQTTNNIQETKQTTNKETIKQVTKNNTNTETKVETVKKTTSNTSSHNPTCEELLGSTWHWNNTKGVCEEVSIVKTRTK